MLGPVLFLAPIVVTVEGPLQRLVLEEAPAFLADHAHDLARMLFLIAVTSIIAALCDSRSFWRVFWAVSIIPRGPRQAQSVQPKTEWQYFRTLNWLVSASFLFALARVTTFHPIFAHDQRAHHTHTDPATLLCVIVCFLCLTCEHPPPSPDPPQTVPLRLPPFTAVSSQTLTW